MNNEKLNKLNKIAYRLSSVFALLTISLLLYQLGSKAGLFEKLNEYEIIKTKEVKYETNTVNSGVDSIIKQVDKSISELNVSNNDVNEKPHLLYFNDIFKLLKNQEGGFSDLKNAKIIVIDGCGFSNNTSIKNGDLNFSFDGKKDLDEINKLPVDIYFSGHGKNASGEIEKKNIFSVIENDDKPEFLASFLTSDKSSSIVIGSSLIKKTRQKKGVYTITISDISSNYNATTDDTKKNIDVFTRELLKN